MMSKFSIDLSLFVLRYLENSSLNEPLIQSAKGTENHFLGWSKTSLGIYSDKISRRIRFLNEPFSRYFKGKFLANSTIL